MLKPEYFEHKSDVVEEYFRRYEDWLMDKIANTLLTAGELGASADRRLYILESMGLTQQDIIKELNKLTDLSEEELRTLLSDSVQTSFSNDKKVLKRLAEFPAIDSPLIREVIEAEWVKTCGELENLTRSTMEQWQTDVINLLNDAELRVANGQSYSQAVCDVLDNYSKTGMVINYPTGARRTLESAVRCAVVTSLNQTAGQVTNAYIAEGGIEYVLVSAHLGARHSDKGGLYSHDEWQGKVYKIRGSEEGFPNLLEATGYDIDPKTGEGQVVNPHGLHGYNCRHSHQPFFKDMDNPWVDKDGKPLIEPEESQKRYEESQKQRGMERSIRESKRRLNMKQAEIDALPAESMERAQAQADYDALAYRMKCKKQTYDNYCAEHDLQTQTDRLKVAGWGRAEASKARGRARAFEGK